MVLCLLLIGRILVLFWFVVLINKVLDMINVFLLVSKICLFVFIVVSVGKSFVVFIMVVIIVLILGVLDIFFSVLVLERIFVFILYWDVNL